MKTPMQAAIDILNKRAAISGNPMYANGLRQSALILETEFLQSEAAVIRNAYNDDRVSGLLGVKENAKKYFNDKYGNNESEAAAT